MDVRATIGMTFLFGVIAIFLWNMTPRLMRDFSHAGDYVPAQSHTITDYKCTNYNGFMFNECTATFVSPQTHERQQITDLRFGRAPHERGQLLELRDDASSVTTDVSLRTVWNRMAVALFFLLCGVFPAIALIMRSRTADDAPENGSASIAEREPAKAARVERSEMRGFGRRHS